MESYSDTPKISPFLLNIIIYSKDRPFQLQELLLSLKQFVFPSFTLHPISPSRMLLEVQKDRFYAQIFIYYTYSKSLSHVENPFEPLYSSLISEFPWVNFILEDGTLEQHLSLVTSSAPFLSESQVNFFQFMVDDMLFFRRVPIFEVLEGLQQWQKVFCAHLKLYPGVCYSHTQDKLIALPKFERVAKELLQFRRSETELDWNYPFDFCGSVYRLSTVQQVVALCKDREKMKKPNSFEFVGNQVIKENLLAKESPYSLCLNLPVMTVVTVNKVQSQYNTPVYKMEGIDEEEKALLMLNDHMRSGKHYQGSYYARKFFEAVHIGDFVLEMPGEERQPLVAVVMPVFNNAEFLEEAINSILTQTYQQFILVVVNDGSTDPLVAKILSQYNSEKVQILNLPQNKGVSSALNYGIQAALSFSPAYILRMDSDDISLPFRLQIQVDFMEQNPKVDILGAAIELFDENQEGKVMSYPIRDAQIKFSMLFYCCLAHPTVMFRAKTVTVEYREQGKIEDYRLWVEMVKKGCTFANVGCVLLRHRKRTGSASNVVTIQEEAKMKQEWFRQILEGMELEQEVVEEFIKITGREVKDEDVFEKLKHRKTLVQIFDALIKAYSSSAELERIDKEFILKNLEGRKAELALHAVQSDCDIDMLKCLLKGGQLKKLMRVTKPN